MNDNITLSLHVKNNVLPKVKSKPIREQFMQMSKIIDDIGVEGYAMPPKELIEYTKQTNQLEMIQTQLDELDHRTPRWKELKKEYDRIGNEETFSQNQWLTFLSHPVVSKFLEKQILKLNTVVYRQKLSQLASKEDISQADIKYISILKDIVDDARNAMENDIIHISSFYPPREYFDSMKEDMTYDSELGKMVRMNIDYLQLDTDYMSFVDVEKAKTKEARREKRINELIKIKKDSKNVEKIVDEQSTVKQETIDDIFEGVK